MTYLYIEFMEGGMIGVFDRAPGDNAWTDESDWDEIRDGTLKVVRFGERFGEVVEELKPDGTWEEVKLWYRT